MGDPASTEVPLPPSVERLIGNICQHQAQPPPDIEARKILASIGEDSSIHMLNKISQTRIKKTLSGFIKYLAGDYPSVTAAAALSPHKHPCTSVSSTDHDGYSPKPKYPSYAPIFNAERVSTLTTNNTLLFPTSPSEKAREILTLLSELEFRKAFLVLSYIGRRKVEDVMSIHEAHELLRLKDLPMENFESRAWSSYGQRCLEKESPNRRKHNDWDSGRTHLYYCHVWQDGSTSFKGPCLDTTKTHLQRALGDENILIVKFEEEARDSTNFAFGSNNCNAVYNKIAEEGILVGLRRYRLFGYKDGGKKEKEKNPFSSAVKFYFVRMESTAPCDESKPYILASETLHEARCLFMHLHMTSSMAKYASRFSLILSKTIKLQADLDSVVVEEIEDIPCRDQNGSDIYEDGELLIHTDGTGYISQDLAMKCPKDFCNAKFIKDEHFEFVGKTSDGRGKEARLKEPPLLVQCRLFKNGLAAKGTLLVNKKLGSGRIQIRRSMIKVETDSRMTNKQSFNSLEVVATSHKPGRCTLSRTLIALLSFGGVPQEFFLDLLANALEDAQNVFSNKRAALQFLLNRGDRDDVFMARRMILSGVPLNEPSLQNCLSCLASEEKKGLQRGKLPISESFYLMGTADPTGVLDNNQVCVILENGQLSGDVLVYRNPGLHFGDIHVLKATYVEALKDFVGNAKYAIFFSIKGQRSMASEIGDGDLDGDMYWVSRNPQLLAYYKASPPWKRIYSTPDAIQKKPSEFSSEQLERELFRQYLSMRKQSNIMAMAADSWLAFVDRLLILGDDGSYEKEQLKQRMIHLVDIYYDALNAAKSGKKVEFPEELKAEMFPHYMERGNRYHSKSVLGLIYDMVQSSQTETASAEDIWKLPCFVDAEIPNSCLTMWQVRYKEYKKEMCEALLSNDESKHTCADDIIKKYKQMLYGASEFEASDRKMGDIYNEALALYHAVYDYAKSVPDARKCWFAWKVAGSALCRFHAMKETENEDVMVRTPSVLREVMSSKRIT